MKVRSDILETWISPASRQPCPVGFERISGEAVLVKSGGRGQVILSQEKGSAWLMLAPGGALMTELKPAGRSDKPLISSSVLTDDVRHRVGLMGDGWI